jgi:hypothetical protein
MAARQQRLVEEGFPHVGLRALLAWRYRSTEAFLNSYLGSAGQCYFGLTVPMTQRPC